MNTRNYSGLTHLANSPRAQHDYRLATAGDKGFNGCKMETCPACGKRRSHTQFKKPGGRCEKCRGGK